MLKVSSQFLVQILRLIVLHPFFGFAVLFLRKFSGHMILKKIQLIMFSCDHTLGCILRFFRASSCRACFIYKTSISLFDLLILSAAKHLKLLKNKNHHISIQAWWVVSFLFIENGVWASECPSQHLGYRSDCFVFWFFKSICSTFPILIKALYI